MAPGVWFLSFAHRIARVQIEFLQSTIDSFRDTVLYLLRSGRFTQHFFASSMHLLLSVFRIVLFGFVPL